MSKDRPIRRIALDDLGDEYAGAWVEIYKHRTWGEVLELQEVIQNEGIAAMKRAIIRLFVVRWSLDGEPTLDTIEAGDARLGEYIYGKAIEWYGGDQRDTDARKSAVGSGAGESGEGAA